MSDSTFNAIATNVGDAALDGLRSTLAAAGSKFTAQERAQAETFTLNIIYAHLKHLAGVPNDDEMGVLNDTLTQWESAGTTALASAAMNAAKGALSLGGAFAVGAIGQLVKGMIP